jgi:hypothetical protein
MYWRFVMNRKVSVWLLGASLGMGVSVSSVFAERIDKKDVPDNVLHVLQAQMPPGSKKAEYHAGEQNGQKIFELRFETPAGEKTKAVVSRDGKLLQPAAGAPVTPAPATPVTPAPVTPAVTPAPGITPLNLPAVPATLTPEQARAELAQLRAQEDTLRVQYDALDAQSAALVTQHNALEPAARAGDQNAIAQRQRLDDQRNGIVTQQREIAQQIVQLDAQEAKVATAGRIQNEQTAVGSAIGTAAADHDGSPTAVHYARAQRAQIPPATLASLDKFTNGARDLFYRSEEIDGKQSYGVHYVTPENKRFWASAYPSGEVRVQPKLSIYQPGKPLPPGAVPPDFPIDPSPVGAVADNTGGDLRVQTITREQVPPAALAEIDKLTKGNKNVEYRKDTKGNVVSYTTHYVSPDNQRYFATVSDAGKLVVQPQLSNTQPTAVKAAPAAAPAARPGTGAPVTPTPGKSSGSALTPVPNAEVPKAVSSAMMKAADKQAKEWQFFKSGQDFAAHYVGKDGMKYEIRVDDNGKVLSGPTAIK